MGVGGQNNGSWLSPFPLPPTKISWRHFLYGGKAKLIDGKKHIGFANSWGKSIGDNGWQWISEDYFNVPNAIFSIWTLMFDSLIKHTFYIPMQNGQMNLEIVYLQKCLQSLGIFPKDQDTTGYYGVITQAAVFEFQKRYVIKDAWSWLRVWTNMGRNVGPLTLPALNKIFA